MTQDLAGGWRAWFDAQGPALLLYARQWLPRLMDAEDAVQEGFVRFWRSRGRVRDSEAYLFACVRRCALEWHRGRRRRERREEKAARPEESLFVSSLDLDERRRLIEAALARLPLEQREVIVLKIWGDLTFAQIGSVLEVSPNTAASRYRYALDKLRLELASEEAIP
jgi:RNA polymerase sigma-70 factor (ECF subfamily)